MKLDSVSKYVGQGGKNIGKTQQEELIEYTRAMILHFRGHLDPLGCFLLLDPFHFLGLFGFRVHLNF